MIARIFVTFVVQYGQSSVEVLYAQRHR